MQDIKIIQEQFCQNKLSGFVHISEGKILDIFDYQTIAENRLFYTHMEKLQLLSTQEKQHRHNCLVDIFRRYGIMPSTIHIPIYTNPLINQLRDIRDFDQDYLKIQPPMDVEKL